MMEDRPGSYSPTNNAAIGAGIRRREFLKRTALAGGGLVLAQRLLTDGSASVLDKALLVPHLLDEVDQGTASHVTVDVRIRGGVELTDEAIREWMSGNIGVVHT